MLDLTVFSGFPAVFAQILFATLHSALLNAGAHRVILAVEVAKE